MKKTIVSTVLAFVVVLTQAQVRPDINTFSASQRALLATAMMNYITPAVIQDHCVAYSTSGGGIHSDFDFLPFHRMYIERLEDYLILQGLPQFVPLPSWDPSGPVPPEFQFVDPDCGSAGCDPSSPAFTCGLPINWNPGVGLPSFLNLPATAGANNDLCDWFLNPSSPSSANCCPTGLSRVIEGELPNPAGSNYHNQVELTMGGVMGNMRSAAVPAFWLLHAYIDDIWKRWEGNCTQSGLVGQSDLYVKDNHVTVPSERDRGTEPDIDPGPMWISQDIWVRSTNDGFTNDQHQTFEWTSGQPVYVYVRVRNRGTQPSSGSDMVEVYWAKASTGLAWPTPWDGTLNIPPSPDMGNMIGMYFVSSIAAGDQEIYEFAWLPPNPDDYAAFGYDKGHFCLLARVLETSKPNDGMFKVEDWDLVDNVRKNNNLCWKNITILNNVPGIVAPPDAGGLSETSVGCVIVRNMNQDGGTTPIRLTMNVPADEGDDNFFAHGTVELEMGGALFQQWMANGMQGDGFEFKGNAVQLNKAGAWIGGLNLQAFEPHNICVKFTATDQGAAQRTFRTDLVQSTDAADGATTINGGERFTINVLAPGTTNPPQQGKLANPSANAADQEGLRLYPNPAHNSLTIAGDNSKTNYTLHIMDLLGKEMYSGRFTGKTQLDVSSFPKGIYSVELINMESGSREVKKLILE